MARALTVTVSVPGGLHVCCDGADELALTVPSVKAALDELERAHPNLHRSICDETGAVRRHINLFVNTDHIRDLEGLETALAPGDTLNVLPAVSGG
ncbi:MAG: MoaD/ThiS family protein [Acidobacteria bacterium]|nr:MoaD/ThiS family protein [Acidobacteriota bacterium]